VQLSAAPTLGGLEQALAQSLGDPTLRLAYPLPDGGYVAPDGRLRDPGPASTALLRDGSEVARVSHKPGLLDDASLGAAVAATAGLALDHERLRAELLAHLAELQSSRARVVEMADLERRRLERNLHDGAQQRLVALTLDLGVVRARLKNQPAHDETLLRRVELASGELRTALDELRVLANGIFPAVLADEGLAAAVQSLAEEQPGRIRILSLPERRLDHPVESAAYRVILETLRPAAEAISLAARLDNGQLVLEVDSDRLPEDVDELEDRVGALNGTLDLEQADGHAKIRAEIPCAS
jgi:signal transduction histidine kinase